MSFYGLIAYFFWALSNILLPGYTTVYFPFTSWRTSWLFPGLTIKNTAWGDNCADIGFSSFVKYQRAQFLDCVMNMFSLIRNCQTVFQSDCAIFHSHQQWMNSCYSASLPAHSNRYVVVSHSRFNLHFLMTNDVEYLFICLFAICISAVLDVS